MDKTGRREGREEKVVNGRKSRARERERDGPYSQT